MNKMRTHTHRGLRGQGQHMCAECGVRPTVKKPNGTFELICNHCKTAGLFGAKPLKKPPPQPPQQRRRR